MMGKKTQGKADGGKRIPKRIAGVKLPKEVRRRGEALIDAAQSPAGRDAIAKGLTMAATFATMAAQRSRAAAAPHEAQSGEGAPAAPTPPIDPLKMAETVNTVADAVLGRLFGKKA